MTRKRMPPGVYTAVMERSCVDVMGPLCEVNAPGCEWRVSHWHHRKMRSQGGGHDVVNGLAVCGACHRAIHAAPKAAYAAGWLVRGSSDPADVLVRVRGAWTRLTPDGGYGAVETEEK